MYHLRFLLHVVGASKLNLAFYLLKSLSKMETQLRNHPDHTSHSIFHHGLKKLLLLNELRKKSWTWLHFLFWSGFEVEKIEIAEKEIDGKSKEKPL